MQFIGCLSTLIDVAGRRPKPTPIGTHHFAMLFVVWGPILTFGKNICSISYSSTHNESCRFIEYCQESPPSCVFNIMDIITDSSQTHTQDITHNSGFYVFNRISKEYNLPSL